MTTDLETAIAVIAASAQRITDAMVAKGLDQPEASYSIGVNGIRYAIAYHNVGDRRESICTIGPHTEAAMIDMIAAKPDPADAARAEHARLLARAAEIAAQHGFGHDAT